MFSTRIEPKVGDIVKGRLWSVGLGNPVKASPEWELKITHVVKQRYFKVKCPNGEYNRFDMMGCDLTPKDRMELRLTEYIAKDSV